MASAKTHMPASLLEGIKAWVNKEPLPGGMRIGGAEVVATTVEDIPTAVTEFVRETISASRSDQSGLDELVRDIKSSFNNIVRNGTAELDDVVTYKSLDILLNVSALTPRSDILGSIAAALESDVFASLPGSWKEQLAEGFIHATFQLAYIEIRSGRVTNAGVARSVRRVLEYLLRHELLTEKHAHIVLFLILVSRAEQEGFVRFLNLLAELEGSDRITDFHSMEAWYLEPIIDNIRSSPMCLLDLNGAGFRALTTWFSALPSTHPRHQLAALYAGIRIRAGMIAALQNMGLNTPEVVTPHVLAA